MGYLNIFKIRSQEINRENQHTASSLQQPSFHEQQQQIILEDSSYRTKVRRLKRETTPLQQRLIQLSANQEKEAAELLIRYTNNPHGYSALEEAVFQKDYHAIDLFFNYGYISNQPNRPINYSPLQIAVCSEDRQMISYLLAKGCQFTSADLAYISTTERSLERLNLVKTYITDLSRFAFNFSEANEIVKKATPEVIYFLLDNKISFNAKINIKIDNRKDAILNVLSAAVQRGNLDIVRALVEHGIEINSGIYQEAGPRYSGANSNPLAIAVFSHRYDIATYLLEMGAIPVWDISTRKDPKTGHYDGLGALLKQAAVDKAYSFVTLLLKKGLPSNYQYNDDSNDTILVRAIKLGDSNLVNALLEGGANPNYPSYNKNQPILPLKIAIELGNADIVAALIKYQARID